MRAFQSVAIQEFAEALTLLAGRIAVWGPVHRRQRRSGNRSCQRGMSERLRFLFLQHTRYAEHFNLRSIFFADSEQDRRNFIFCAT